MSGLPLRAVLVTLGLVCVVSSSTPQAPLTAPIQLALRPFPLSAVTLTPGSQEAEAAQLNAEYLRMIETDSLLYTFRQNAGLPTPGTPFWRVRRLACHAS